MPKRVTATDLKIDHALSVNEALPPAQRLTQAQLANKLNIHPVTISNSKKKLAKFLDSHPSMIKASGEFRKEALKRAMTLPKEPNPNDYKLPNGEFDTKAFREASKEYGKKLAFCVAHLPAATQISTRIQDRVDPAVKMSQSVNVSFDITCKSVDLDDIRPQHIVIDTDNE